VIAGPQLYLAFENMVVAPEKLAKADMVPIKMHKSPYDLPVRFVIFDDDAPFSGIIQLELLVGKMNPPSFDFTEFGPKDGLIVCMNRGANGRKDN
jgi:hypothetical protein